jgi:hypothetical protein
MHLASRIFGCRRVPPDFPLPGALQMSHLPSRTLGLALGAGLLLLAACSAKEPVSPAPAEPDTSAAAAAEPAETHADHDMDAAGHQDHADDDETGGGTPHVHGIADLAISREDNILFGELISPMANLGLSESDGTYSDVVTAELGGLVEIVGGECAASVPHPMTDSSGGHTDSIVHFTWTCAKPDAVTAIRFAGFEAFPVFEKVGAVYITPTEQRAGELTPAAPELSLK